MSSSDSNGAAAAAAGADQAVPRSAWLLPASLSSQRTLNPIRAIVDKLVVPPNASKPLIPLSIGDPTVFGNLLPPAGAMAELCRLVTEGKSNGYAASVGTKAAREAIARRYTENCPHGQLTADDVMICSGASGALQIALDASLSPGDNILLPRPGFSLYATICGHLGVEVRYYDLLPERNWEADLTQAASLVDGKTRAMLVNNPSNPNGSNFSLAHLEAIVGFAEQHKLLLIADEIYGDMVFSGQRYTPLANVSKSVPVIAVGGLAKQYVLPGWRIGWLMFHDRQGKLKAVQDGALRLTQVILGANTLCQSLVPHLLFETPAAYYSELNQTLESQSLYLYKELRKLPGIKPVEPQACMYLMLGIEVEKFGPGLQDDVEFSKALLSEELLFVLPGSCFLAPNFVRLVTCAPMKVLEDAVGRFKAFVDRHILPEFKQ